MQTIQRVQSLRQARKQQGFTIIELVVVILLLGILAATALPRFMDVTDEAHESVVSGLQGGLATGAALFRAQWYATGQPVGSAIAEFGEGNLFANADGYPTGDSATFDVNSCVEIYNELLQSGRPAAVASVGTGIGDPEIVVGTPFASVITTSATPLQIETAANNGADIVAVTGTGAIYCANDDGIDPTCVGTEYFTDAADAAASAIGITPGEDGITLAAAQAAQLGNGSCTFYYTGQYRDRQTGLDGSAAAAGEPVNGLETLVLSLTNGSISRSITAFE